MEKPSPETIAWYDRSLPDDPRAVRGQMFGHPCAFVHGNMFFGTFAQTLIARVGVPRAAELSTQGLAVFEPMPRRPWKDYVAIRPGDRADAEVAALAREALEATALLPPKAKKPAKRK